MRKLFHPLAIVAMGVAILSGFALTASKPARSPEFNRIEKIVMRLDAAEKSLPTTHYEVNDLSMYEWAVEILPFFQSTGIEDTVTMPSNIQFELFLDPFRINMADQVLAYAQCNFDNLIVINARQANPLSAWYGMPNFVLTLAHELAHVQGACGGSSVLDESSAQEMSLTVLAAMVDDGNSKVFLSLVDELRGMGIGSLRYLAMKDPALMPRFQKDLNKIFPNAFDRADFAQRVRFWTGHERERKDLLYKYSYLPFTHIMDSLKSGKLTGVETRPGATKTIDISDIRYVMNHLMDLANGVRGH